MLSIAKIKFIKSLVQKKNRTAQGLFVAEGVKVVNDLVNSNYNINEVFATDVYLDAHKTLLLNKPFDIVKVTEKELERISSLKTPHQVVAVCKSKQNVCDTQALKKNWSFVLDGINDPGNLGTIIRIAHWFGINNIVCSPDTVDVYNPKTVQSTMGSLAAVNVIYTDIADMLKTLKNDIEIYGTFVNGKPIYEYNFKKSGLIVLGSESHGISPEIAELIVHKIAIPPFNQQHMPDSLNVAVSAGIAAYAICKT